MTVLFEKWYKEMIEDNPLWKIENPNWRDVKTIAKFAWQEGEHQEWERNLKKKLKKIT